MNSIRKKLALLTWFGVTVGAAFGAGPISFEEAVHIAVQNSPTIGTFRNDLNIRTLEYRNTISNFLPQLDFTALEGLQNNDPGTQTTNSVRELKLQVTENLYDNGNGLTRFRSAKILNEVAELTFKNERDRLVLDVGLEFVRYSLAKSLNEVQEQQFSIVRRQFDSVLNQYQQGVKARRDYLRFKSELRRAEIDLQNSQTAVERSRVELMRLMGYDVSAKADPLDFKPLEVDLSSVAHIPSKTPKLAEHYQFRLAGLQKKVFENDVYFVRRRYWPEVFLTAGAAYRVGDYLRRDVISLGTENITWNALINLKFNLVDWGIRSREIAIAETRRMRAENVLSVDLNAFSSNNAKVMLELKQTSKNFALARELLDLENKSYQSLAGEYRNGKANFLDIIVGLRNLLGAKIQMYTSYFDLKGQLLRYRYHQGGLYESVSAK